MSTDPASHPTLLQPTAGRPSRQGAAGLPEGHAGHAAQQRRECTGVCVCERACVRVSVRACVCACVCVRAEQGREAPGVRAGALLLLSGSSSGRTGLAGDGYLAFFVCMLPLTATRRSCTCTPAV